MAISGNFKLRRFGFIGKGAMTHRVPGPVEPVCCVYKFRECFPKGKWSPRR